MGAVMARFRLNAPHILELAGTPVYCEPGREIDTSEMPSHFRPSPLMEPLDPEAEAMWHEVIARIRAANPGTRLASVPVIGSMHHLPGGDLYQPK
jgi:hypothetical protein